MPTRTLSDPLAQSTLRKAFLKVLRDAAVAPTIVSPGDWSVAPEKTPTVQVRISEAVKQGKGNAGPIAFDTDVMIEVRAITSALTGEDAQDAIELLGADVEDALFRSPLLGHVVQSYRTVGTRTEVSAGQSMHYGSMAWAIRCQVYERFLPEITAILEGITLTADLTNVADPTGTYPDPAFPAAVKPAPRTEGPDGRVEGFVNVQFEND